MRLVPVALRFWNDRDWLHHAAAQQSLTTHAAEEAVDGCRSLRRLAGSAKGSSVGPAKDGTGGQLPQYPSRSQTAQESRARPIAQLKDRKRQRCLSALPIPTPNTVHV